MVLAGAGPGDGAVRDRREAGRRGRFVRRARAALLAAAVLVGLALPVPGARALSVRVNGAVLRLDPAPVVVSGRTLVPMRAIAEALGAEVAWEAASRTAVVSLGARRVEIVPGRRTARIDGAEAALDQPALVVAGRTMLPLRFVAEALGFRVAYDAAADAAEIVDPALEAASRRFRLSTGRAVTVQVVTADLARYGVKTVLAGGRVGRVESLEGMARRHGAAAAINGGYFNAYAADLPRLPFGTLIVDGRVAHLGNYGSSLAVTAEGEVRIRSAKPEFKGYVGVQVAHPWDEWRKNWWTTYVNRIAAADGSEVVIHTPDAFGDTTGSAAGTQVVVKAGRVAWPVRGEPAFIPPDGFVIQLTGENEAKLADRFQTGTEVRYSVGFTDRWTGERLPWDGAAQMVTAGPELVRDGKVAVTPESVRAEGFSEAKITTMSIPRSAVGVTADGRLLLVTVPSATVYEMGEVMAALGAREAMCLDGGASSGLWVGGRYVTRPGRELSNALVLVPR